MNKIIFTCIFLLIFLFNSTGLTYENDVFIYCTWEKENEVKEDKTMIVSKRDEVINPEIYDFYLKFSAKKQTLETDAHPQIKDIKLKMGRELHNNKEYFLDTFSNKPDEISFNIVMGSCKEFLCEPGEAERSVITINKFNLGLTIYGHWLGIKYPHKVQFYSCTDKLLIR